MNLERLKRYSSRAEFLSDLQQQCALRFEPEVASAMLAEVDAHLEESIQARLELGDSETEAERSAIAAFHNPHGFAQSMGRVHRDRTRHDSTLFAVGIGFIVWVALWIPINFASREWYVWPLGALVLTVSIGIRSIAIGGPRLGTLLRLSVAAVVVSALFSPLMVINLWAYDGMGYVSPQMARQLAARSYQPASADSAESFVSVRDQIENDNVGASVRALKAPLWQRYTTNFSQTIQMLVVALGVLIFAHLAPAAVRRRWNRFLSSNRSRFVS